MGITKTDSRLPRSSNASGWRLLRTFPTLNPIVLTIATVGFATLLRMIFTPALGTGYAFITYYPAIIFSTLVGGWQCGLLASLLSEVMAVVLFIDPIASPEHAAALLIFLLLSTIMVATADTVVRARRRAELRVDCVLAEDEGLRQEIATHERAEESLELRVKARTQELEASQQNLRALAAELNLAEQRERSRVAADLHDYLQQMLVAARLKLHQGKHLAEPIPPCAKLIDDTDGILSDALTYTRTLVAELNPPVLRLAGLPAALRWLSEYMKKREMVVTVTVPDGADINVPEDQALLLFQSVRELLINAWKHAKSRETWVRLEQRTGMLEIEVLDNGRGFDLASITTATREPTGGLSSKFGLFSIRERMKALGGSFDIQSSPGYGTRARLRLPIGIPTENRATSVLLVDDHEIMRQGHA